MGSLLEDRYTFIDHISLSYSQNEKCFRKKIFQEINTNFVLNNFFFSKSYRFLDNVEYIVVRADHRRQYCACALHAE